MAFVFGLMFILFIFAILGYIVTCFFKMKQFKKAGVSAPGIAFIPVYSTYKEYQLYSKPEYFWIIIILTLASSVIQSLVAKSNAEVVVISLAIVSIVLALATSALSIYMLYKKCKSFGYGAGFCIGMIFLPIVFDAILAFNSASYLGNTDTGIPIVDEYTDRFVGNKQEDDYYSDEN